MEVKLLNYTHDALETMYRAAKTCYKFEAPQDLEIPRSPDKYQKMLDLIDHCFESGHLSIAEHMTVTFGIKGISRAASHQLVRHRHCTFSHQSQRYVDMHNTQFVEPYSIVTNREADTIYNNLLSKIMQAYDYLVTELNIPQEDARYLLPNATESNMVITLNLREFMYLCNIRLCSRAQDEIRGIIKEMANELISVCPYLKKYLVCKCDKDGYCTEGNSCGRKPKRKCS